MFDALVPITSTHVMVMIELAFALSAAALTGYLTARGIAGCLPVRPSGGRQGPCPGPIAGPPHGEMNPAAVETKTTDTERRRSCPRTHW